MKLFKIFAIVVAGLFLAVPAWAGNVPEFDAVGCDGANFFAQTNLPYQMVTGNSYFPHPNQGWQPLEWYSSFVQENFWTSAGLLLDDPCYGILSALTDAYNSGEYEWNIVLQMKPESDINLNIYDCVLKHNETDLWLNAEQTGRYRADWGQVMFVPSANPLIYAQAYPGQFHTIGFTAPFTMDARTLPGLETIPLDGQLYTSKAHWEEGIVMVMPETLKQNSLGQDTYNLKEGDRIFVRVEVPYNNTADVRYGPESVLLKYIGVYGKWYFTDSYCQD